MSERTYYRLTLVLPFVAGAIWARFATSPGIRDFVLWMALSPYALFAIGLIVWSIDKPAGSIRKAVLLSPLFFTVPMTLVAFPLALLVFGSGFAETFLTLAPIVLVVGYTCVAAALLLRELFRAVGVIRPDMQEAGPAS